MGNRLRFLFVFFVLIFFTLSTVPALASERSQAQESTLVEALEIVEEAVSEEEDSVVVVDTNLQWHRVTYYSLYGAELWFIDMLDGHLLPEAFSAPALEGYAFQFWYNETGTRIVPFNFSRPIKGNINLIPFYEVEDADDEIAEPIEEDDINILINQLMGVEMPDNPENVVSTEEMPASTLLTDTSSDAVHKGTQESAFILEKEIETATPIDILMSQDEVAKAIVEGILKNNGTDASDKTTGAVQQGEKQEQSTDELLIALMNTGNQTELPDSQEPNNILVDEPEEIITPLDTEEEKEILTPAVEEDASVQSNNETEDVEVPDTSADEDTNEPLVPVEVSLDDMSEAAVNSLFEDMDVSTPTAKVSAVPNPYVLVDCWINGDSLEWGTEIVLTAYPFNFPEGSTLHYQWQNDAGGSFQDVPGMTGKTISFFADGSNTGCNWQAYVTAAK